MIPHGQTAVAQIWNVLAKLGRTWRDRLVNWSSLSKCKHSVLALPHIFSHDVHTHLLSVILVLTLSDPHVLKLILTLLTMIFILTLNDPPESDDITVVVVEYARGESAIPACSPTLLVIALHRLGHWVVQHKPDIRLVNTHTKRYGGTDNLWNTSVDKGHVQWDKWNKCGCYLPVKVTAIVDLSLYGKQVLRYILCMINS